MLNIKENIVLAPYTVFKIGGLADYFCEVKNKEELIEALDWAGHKKLLFFILGAGSNILVSDEGYRGLVIKMNLQELKMDGEKKIFAGSGLSMARVVNFAIENNLGGFEWGIGVPGSIGGSVYGNAGCYGGEMKDVVENIEVLGIETLTANIVPREACDFSYRHSAFKRHPEWIILGATLSLASSNSNDSRAKVLEYSRRRTQTQAIGSKCAGCIFKNYIPASGGSVISAGFLIDKAGLKGRTVGGAAVSEKHANFIINNGLATARDIKELIGVIKDEVQKAHGVLLEEEIKII